MAKKDEKPSGDNHQGSQQEPRKRAEAGIWERQPDGTLKKLTGQ